MKWLIYILHESLDLLPLSWSFELAIDTQTFLCEDASGFLFFGVLAFATSVVWQWHKILSPARTLAPYNGKD